MKLLHVQRRDVACAADNEIPSSEKETALFTRFSLRLLCVSHTKKKKRKPPAGNRRFAWTHWHRRGAWFAGSEGREGTINQ